jgi:hypothetical protein
VAGVGTTNASAAITGPAGAFQTGDAGRTITGTGIPGGATILSVQSATAATLSANATATGTISASLGAATATGYSFIGWEPESDAEAATYSIAGGAGASAPDRITSPNQGIAQRSRL